MVLQRLQSLYLLIAAILMVVFAFMTPVTLTAGSDVYNLSVLYAESPQMPKPNALMLILDILIVVLTLITIFKFKNLGYQMKLTAICCALTISLILSVYVMVFAVKDQAAVTYSASIAYPVVALLFYIMAYRGISKDKRKIRESESIR